MKMNIIINVALIHYNLHNNYTNTIDRKYGKREFTGMYIYISDMKFAQLSCTGQCLVDVLDVPAESSKNSQSIHIRKIQCHKLYCNFIRKKTS